MAKVGEASASECVKVMVRCRPINSSETSKGSKQCVNIVRDLNQIKLLKGATQTNQTGHYDTRSFTYDSVYGPEST